MAPAAARIWATLDAFVEGGPLLGRRVANTSFLSALLAADPFDAYHFYLGNEEERSRLESWLREAFPALARRGALVCALRVDLPARLHDTPFHCMHLSDAVTRFAELAQLRNVFAPHIFPLTGLTHSLSYARFMPAYLRLLWPGVSSRDAVMVTSESARSVLERAFNGLRAHYGLDAGIFRAPHLERLPLGVDLESLPGKEERWDAPGGSAARELRAGLDIGDEPVFLCLGRLCPHSKMDLMPLLAALQRAGREGLPAGSYTLVLAGWAEQGDALPETLLAYAKSLGIRTRLALRPSDAERRALYAAADVFVSPSDNIQETFGLTVAEAGASGLPVIASDFDGYRDIVEHGQSGLLVPTLGFADSGESDLLPLVWFDNQYHLKLAQQTVVDLPALSSALARLGADAALRRRMGEAGRQRVRERFSWERVIKNMTALWDRLAALPLPPGEEERLRGARHPQLMRFADYFHGHFSQRLDSDLLESWTLRRTEAGEALYRGALPLVRYAGMERLLDGEAVRRMLLLARRETPAERVMDALQEYFAGRSLPLEIARERASFTLLWALKQGYLERAGQA